MTSRFKEFHGTSLSERDFKDGKVLFNHDELKADFAWDTGIGIGAYLAGLKRGQILGSFCSTCILCIPTIGILTNFILRCFCFVCISLVRLGCIHFAVAICNWFRLFDGLVTFSIFLGGQLPYHMPFTDTITHRNAQGH